MSLAEEAQQLRQPKGERCSVGIFLATLTDAERAEVDEAVGVPGLPITAIVRAMGNRWPDVPHYRNWQRHYLRGECTCG